MKNETVTLDRGPEIQRWSANWHMEEFYKSPHGNHVTYRDHRAHVTMLQAEVERLKDEAGIYRTGYALLKEEHAALQAELTKALEDLSTANDKLRRQDIASQYKDGQIAKHAGEMAMLQSELTRAREYIQSLRGVAHTKGGITLDASIDAFLAHQSAPAAKDEQPAPVAVELADRSPEDYAIEHAEYMAKSADDVMAKFQAYGLALLAVDEGGDDGEGELFEAIDTARGDLQESLVDLRSMVYEFRKRSNRCTSL